MMIAAPSRVVRGYTGYAENGDPVTREELPHPGPVLVISLGPSIDVDGQVLRSFVGGLDDSPSRTAHAGEQAGVQVRLDPFAARGLLGMPIGALARQVVPLDAVLGRTAAELEERLADAPSWPARFRILDDVFARRLAEAPQAPRDVRWAWQRLIGEPVRVDELARELGWSRRHFTHRFTTELGMAPKAVARIARFARARDLLGSGTPLGQVALSCGYYDQAHMNRDFRDLGGCAPGELLARGGGSAAAQSAPSRSARLAGAPG
jgi:AraC-like DNA-binding protein